MEKCLWDAGRWRRSLETAEVTVPRTEVITWMAAVPGPGHLVSGIRCHSSEAHTSFHMYSKCGAADGRFVFGRVHSLFTREDGKSGEISPEPEIKHTFTVNVYVCGTL